VLTVLNGLGTVQEASSQLEKMGIDFSYPKPVRLLAYLIKSVCSDKNAIIMDSFAGSATTGHAVLQLNQEDGGKRQFVLVELDPNIAKEKAAKRLHKVISGYAGVAALGSGFRFCNLGEALFDAEGNVNPSVTFTDLAAHVFFCETGSPIPRKADFSSTLIGAFQDRAIYLLHSSQSIGVPNASAGNVLNVEILENLPPPSKDFSGQRVVYAEGCTVPEDRLAAHGVTFKQVPYQIEGL
jgi:adenine-specific DNA-methyltransferase